MLIQKEMLPSLYIEADWYTILKFLLFLMRFSV